MPSYAYIIELIKSLVKFQILNFAWFYSDNSEYKVKTNPLLFLNIILPYTHLKLSSSNFILYLQTCDMLEHLYNHFPL